MYSALTINNTTSISGILTIPEPIVTYILYPIYYSLIAIVLGVALFKIVSGFLNNVVIRRLTKASFKLDIISIMDLWFSYYISMVSYFVIYPYIPIDRNPHIALIFGLGLVYFGRIETKFRGVFYGKLHFTALFILGFIFIFLNAIFTVTSSSYFHELMVTQIIDYINKYNELLLWSAVGTGVLATLGEAILLFLPSNSKGLLTSSEKIPSDFKTITGIQCNKNLNNLYTELKGKHSEIKDKLNELLSEENLISVKYATRYLGLVEALDKYISESTNNVKYFVLKLPKRLALDSYEQTVNERHPSIDLFTKERTEDIENFKNIYRIRSAVLSAYSHLKMIDWMDEYNFGNISFIICEYPEQVRKLMIFVRDTGPRNERIALYSEEPYIIEMFSNIFDAGWKMDDGKENNQKIKKCHLTKRYKKSKFSI